MEPQKDTNQKDVISRDDNFVSNHGDIGVRATSPIFKEVFVLDGDKKYGFIPKAEKVIAAVYMVTDFISDNNPLKERIRQCGVELISDIFSFSPTTDILSRCSGITQRMEEIESILSIASMTRLVSSMNVSILRGEIGLLKQSLSNLEGAKALNEKLSPITKDFFSTPVFEPLTPLSVGNTQEYARKGQNSIKDKKYNSLSFISLRNKTVARAEETKGQLVIVKPKNSRKETILKILRDKKDITIKDLPGLISGCSEKTIQRELLSLVAAGVLKKEGEKRWSRYSLN